MLSLITVRRWYCIGKCFIFWSVVTIFLVFTWFTRYSYISYISTLIKHVLRKFQVRKASCFFIFMQKLVTRTLSDCNNFLYRIWSCNLVVKFIIYEAVKTFSAQPVLNSNDYRWAMICKKRISPFFYSKIVFFQGSIVHTHSHIYSQKIMSPNATIVEKIDFEVTMLKGNCFFTFS